MRSIAIWMQLGGTTRSVIAVCSTSVIVGIIAILALVLFFRWQPIKAYVLPEKPKDCIYTEDYIIIPIEACEEIKIGPNDRFESCKLPKDVTFSYEKGFPVKICNGSDEHQIVWFTHFKNQNK